MRIDAMHSFSYSLTGEPFAGTYKLATITGKTGAYCIGLKGKKEAPAVRPIVSSGP
jgi:hypothetical protein